MNCILQRMGGNDYKLPHMNKEKLQRIRQLPLTIEMDREARIACRGQPVAAAAAATTEQSPQFAAL